MSWGDSTVDRVLALHEANTFNHATLYPNLLGMFPENKTRNKLGVLSSKAGQTKQNKKQFHCAYLN